MTTLMLAVRNLLRNRRRSLATLLAMAIGSASILLFGGYSSNISVTMQTAYVRSGGHLQIQHRDFYLYGSGNPTAYGIRDYQKVLDAVRTDEVLKPLLAVATPTLQFGGIAGNYAAGVSRTVIGSGLIADDFVAMRDWNDYGLSIPDPPFSLRGSPPDAAVIGTGVARVLQLCAELKVQSCPQQQGDESKKPVPAAAAAQLPDDIAALSAQEAPAATAAAPKQGAAPRIELLASNANGTPNVASLQVVRAEKQGFKELDEIYVLTHLAQAQRLIYGKEPPRVTSIVLQLRRTDQIARAQARLDALLPTLGLSQPLAVTDFRALNPFYTQTVQLFDTIFGFIFALIGSIVLFNVSNTMNTAVVERTVEIGTLRAIGLRQGGIRRLFVIEGFLLGVAGAIVGLLFALLAAVLINQAGLTWVPPSAADPVPLVVRVWSEQRMMVGTTLGLIVIATVSAWWPASRAAKLGVVDALRHV